MKLEDALQCTDGVEHPAYRDLKHPLLHTKRAPLQNGFLVARRWWCFGPLLINRLEPARGAI